MNPDDEDPQQQQGSQFEWTLISILQAVVIFFLSGMAEIGGGWLVWKTIREQKPWWWALLGGATLVVYGFLPTLQPVDSFGRIYAVYGGFFILLSFLVGWWLDGDRPDWGDLVGGMVALSGVLVILFWPR